MSYEPDRSKSRIIWVDIARAVAMVLVLPGISVRAGFRSWNHCWLPYIPSTCPLFFLLSGLFFKPTVNLLNLIIKRAKTLLIPYYLFSVFALVSPIVKLLRPSLYESAGKSADSNPLSAIIAIVFVTGQCWIMVLVVIVRSHTLSMAYSASRAIQ